MQMITEDNDSGEQNDALASESLCNSWSDADAKIFVLGLFIFGKNFIMIKRFIEKKGMGEILSFYYGKFYKSDEYSRWAKCRKMKGRKCIIGEKLFTGWRQNELLSRLIPLVSKESQNTLKQISKSYVVGKSSLEEYISSLKSMVGLAVLVEAVGIGKEKEDLTILTMKPGKNNRASSARTSKAWSSHGPSDIINFLRGGSRLSKAKSNDIFWEAVWPCLSSRGWHSEQLKNPGCVSFKDNLVFLIPGMKKFSRRKLVKGDHYFDSVIDVLSKVVAEPSLLGLEEEAKVGSCNDKEPEKGLNEDNQYEPNPQCYPKPEASKFMDIDTILVRCRKSSALSEMNSVPVDSVGEVDIDAAGITYKETKDTKKVNHSKDMSENSEQELTKFIVVNTSTYNEGKQLKVREPRYVPAELEDAYNMTGLSTGSNGSPCDDDSPSVMEANIPIYDNKNKNISNTDSQKDISESGATNQEEAYDKQVYNANKELDSQRNQKTCVSDDNQQKKSIKHQFSRRRRSNHSNDAVLPIKRMRLTACAKAETTCNTENSSVGLSSEKVAFSQSMSFPEANKNVGDCDTLSLQHNGSLIASSAEGCVGENNEESILSETSDSMIVSSVIIAEKCDETQSLVTGNEEIAPMVEEDGLCITANDRCLSSETQEVVEKSLRTSCEEELLEDQAQEYSSSASPPNLNAQHEMLIRKDSKMPTLMDQQIRRLGALVSHMRRIRELLSELRACENAN